jgi:Na+/H+-dicarboxylate symporter
MGIAAHSSGSRVLTNLGESITPVGEVWINLLRLVAIPLIICLLIPAVAKLQHGGDVGRLGGASLGTFASLLVFGGLVSLAISLPLLKVLPPNLGLTILPDAASHIPVDADNGLGAWLVKLVPNNAFAAAASGDLLPLLVVTLLFALAVRGISEPNRKLIVDFFTAVGEAMMKMIGWAIVVMPVGVFALAYGFGMKHGVAIAGVAAYFIVFISAVCIALVLLMYPIAVLIGRIDLKRFAVGVAPSQTVAATTRSSLATLPTVIEGAEKAIGLSPSTTSFVLPLAASIFKPNRPLTSLAMLVFLAAVFGITLSPGAILVFFATVIILSVGTPGIPSGSGYSAVGVYLAVGIPLEGYVFFKSLDPIPDVFKTIVNVTGFMTAAVLVERFARPKAEVEQLEPIPQA